MSNWGLTPGRSHKRMRVRRLTPIVDPRLPEVESTLPLSWEPVSRLSSRLAPTGADNPHGLYRRRGRLTWVPRLASPRSSGTASCLWLPVPAPTIGGDAGYGAIPILVRRGRLRRNCLAICDRDLRVSTVGANVQFQTLVISATIVGERATRSHTSLLARAASSQCLTCSQTLAIYELAGISRS